MTVRKRAEAVGKILDGLRGLLADPDVMLRRGRPNRDDNLRPPHRISRRRSDDLNLPCREVLLHTACRVGLDSDTAHASRGLPVLAEVKPGQWNVTIRDPPRHLLPVRLRNLTLQDLCRFSCRHQCPVLGIAELQIEISHFHTAVWIPGAASANIQQPAALFLQNFSPVGKFQLEFLTGSRGLWKYNRDHIVTPA